MGIARVDPLHVYRKNRLVVLEEYTESGATDRGQPEGAWGTVDSVWADIRPLSTATAEAAHQLYGEATHRIFIDYRSGVTTANRITYGSRVFQIGHVANVDERDIVLSLLVKELL